MNLDKQVMPCMNGGIVNNKAHFAIAPEMIKYLEIYHGFFIATNIVQVGIYIS